MKIPEHNISPELILVVDDDTVIRLLMRESLEQAGLTVIEAKNGAQALQVFAERNPDLVLLDVKMPNMDGYEVCTRIHQLDDGKETPVIMVTGLEDDHSIEQAYQAGATDFITKPVVWTILSHRVRYLLRAGKAFKALRLNEDRLTQAQRVARLGNWEWDISKDRFHWSDEMYRIFDLPKDSFNITLQSCFSFVHADDLHNVRRTIDRALSENTPFKVEFTIVHRDGSLLTVEQQGEVVVNSQGIPLQMYGTLQDISARKLVESRIRQLAYYDHLTGLPNRQMFYETIKRAMYTSEREGTKMALIFLDLDKFKEVNDTLGHNAGDELLKNIAQYLTKSIRASDVFTQLDKDEDSSASLSRLGGDEFTILLPDLKEIDVAAHVCNRVLDQLRLPMKIEGHNLTITGSMGIAIYPDDGQSIDALLKHSDTAMYHAKQGGKNNFCFYAEQMDEKVKSRMRIENDLQSALERNEFILHYHPRIDIKSGKIVGVEALLRWQHPTRGLLHPEHFIGIADIDKVILPIGEWVIQSACRTMHEWQQSGFDIETITVNLSSPQFFKKARLTEIVKDALQECQLNARHLELELTEAAIIEDQDLVITKFNQLRDIGVGLSLDNFGTGQCSLSYLKRIPLNSLKIDASFVSGISSNAKDATIIESILTLANGLGLCSIAEGLETQQQLEILKKTGCRQVQGPLISHPLSDTEITRLLLADSGQGQPKQKVIPLKQSKKQ